MSRRVKRIYPAFTATFLIDLGLSFVFPAESKIPRATLQAAVYLVQNALLLPGLWPVGAHDHGSMPSLSSEMFYYLSIPLVVAAFGLRYRSVAWRVSFFGAVGMMVLQGGG